MKPCCAKVQRVKATQLIWSFLNLPKGFGGRIKEVKVQTERNLKDSLKSFVAY